MGLFSWILSRKVKKVLNNTDYADEYLKNSMKANADVIRDAEKINKAALLDLQTKKIKSMLRENLSDDEDEEDDDEEDDDEGDFESSINNKIKQMVINQFLPKNQPNALLNTQASELAKNPEVLKIASKIPDDVLKKYMYSQGLGEVYEENKANIKR